MPEVPWRRIRPGGELTAAETNRLTHAAESQSRITGVGGLAGLTGSGDPLIVDPRLPAIWATLGDSAGADYAWVEALETVDETTGLFVFLDGFTTGEVTALPCTEVNGVAGVAAGTIVRAWPALSGDRYLFEAPEAGGGVINNIVINNTLTINVDDETVNNTINNFGDGTRSKLRINASSSSAVITGFTAGKPGQLLIVWNVGAFPLVLAHENAGSLAPNRIITPLHADYTVWPDGGEILEYDGASQRWRFDSPTYGVGNAGGLVQYGNRRTNFKTGLTVVNNADGSVDVNATGGISALVFDEVALATSYTLTGTFANAGFPALLLPTAGKTYKLYADVSASLQTSIAQGYVKIELWDATAGARITNSTRAVLTCPAVAYLTEEGGHVEVVYVAPAANTSIQLYAKYITTGIFAAGQIIGADVNLGESVLGYLQLSY